MYVCLSRRVTFWTWDDVWTRLDLAWDDVWTRLDLVK